MGLRMKKFNIMGVKNPFFRMRSWKTNIYWGRSCQKGDWYPNVHYDFVNLSLKYFSPLPIQRSSHLIRTIMCHPPPPPPFPLIHFLWNRNSYSLIYKCHKIIQSTAFLKTYLSCCDVMILHLKTFSNIL